MDDSKIVDLYLERDEAAIKQTSKKYGKRLRALSFGIVNDQLSAEECENDTYVAVWNAIPPTRPNIFSAFLSKVVRNISINRYEYNRAKKRNSEYDLILSELEECVASVVSVEENYVAGEIQDIADFCGDSLELSIKAKNVSAPVIVFCGVRFMAETAKLLSPDATVLLPQENAGCPHWWFFWLF